MGLVGELLALKYVHSAVVEGHHLPFSWQIFLLFKEVKFAILRQNAA